VVKEHSMGVFSVKNPIVVVKDVTKEYTMGEIKVKASNNMSFEILEGEFVVVLGPSGSGKSTVLNMIGGMDRPTYGEVFVEGKNITKYSDNELTMYRRKNIGFVFQFYPGLFMNLNSMIIIVKNHIEFEFIEFLY